MEFNDRKYACETCIRGHRASKCRHVDRPLQEITKKGRPVRQCEHCRSLRQSHSLHTKCHCGAKASVISAHSSTAGDSERCRCSDGQRCVCGYKKNKVVRPEAGLDKQAESDASEGTPAPRHPTSSYASPSLLGSDFAELSSSWVYQQDNTSLDAFDGASAPGTLSAANTMPWYMPVEGLAGVLPSNGAASINSIPTSDASPYVGFDETLFDGTELSLEHKAFSEWNSLPVTLEAMAVGSYATTPGDSLDMASHESHGGESVQYLETDALGGSGTTLT